MTILTKQQTDGTCGLQSKYKGNSNPTPINSSISVCGGQMTINIGMEWASKQDIMKSNNAAMDMLIADFSF